jgi:alpha-mannosidase
MKLAGARYFLTTKMSWNDTNTFPYDTFYWQGLDGTRVLTHFNCSHLWPSPENLARYTAGEKDGVGGIREKTVSRSRLFSFGYGDGGGGPQFEMLELARRVADVDGLPRTGYTTVSSFMRRLEGELAGKRPSVYAGELYLELHRGTLTNQHQIKRNNRLAELALHTLEYATVRAALAKAAPASGAAIRPLMEKLLVNQFHDILPGTCIPAVHELSVAETGETIREAECQTRQLLKGEDAGTWVGITNTLSFARDDVMYLDEGSYILPSSARQQPVATLLHGKKVAVAGLTLEPFSSRSVERGESTPKPGASPFLYAGNRLETPFATVQFADNGTIASFRDKTAHNRELRGEGYPLGTLLIAEDVSLSWDNWDIDGDLEYKYADCSQLLSRSVVADGAVEFRIRSSYRISAKSTLEQDLVFYADSPLVLFEARINWQDTHRFLKVAFDTSIRAADARYEIQFGHIRRSVFRGTDLEKAKFEVVNHKYTDLSESRYGVALLNDCKYGISVYEGQLRLSLHKGGNRPDTRGDIGSHECAYGFLPHGGGFSAETVVRPAYLFNYRPVLSEGKLETAPLTTVDAPTVVVETVKPCEDAQNAFILRLYECEGSQTHTTLHAAGAKQLVETNLLEDALGEPLDADHIELSFHPFEIKTLMVRY